MQQKQAREKQTRDFLIRNIPIEIYNLLEAVAKENHRSKTQEAIVALNNGLSMYGQRISKPKPFKWKKTVSERFVEEAIKEGRE